MMNYESGLAAVRRVSVPGTGELYDGWAWGCLSGKGGVLPGGGGDKSYMACRTYLALFEQAGLLFETHGQDGRALFKATG